MVLRIIHLVIRTVLGKSKNNITVIRTKILFDLEICAKMVVYCVLSPAVKKYESFIQPFAY